MTPTRKGNFSLSRNRDLVIELLSKDKLWIWAKGKVMEAIPFSNKYRKIIKNKLE
jgi:hypothetical protein